MSQARPLPDWMETISAAVAAQGARGTFLVCFPAYRPELARALAERLDLEYLDFRAASLAPLGWRASALTLDALDQAIARRSDRGMVLHNAEALLATKPAEERIAWLTGSVTRVQGALALVTLAVFDGEAPAESERVCRLAPEDMPPEKLLVRLASR